VYTLTISNATFSGVYWGYYFNGKLIDN